MGFSECWPESCLLVLNEEFDLYGLGCMKLFAQRLLQHSWALSPNDCWPYVFFLSDDVSQFREWNQGAWTNISLLALLTTLEQWIQELCELGGGPPCLTYKQKEVSRKII